MEALHVAEKMDDCPDDMKTEKTKHTTIRNTKKAIAKKPAAGQRNSK